MLILNLGCGTKTSNHPDVVNIDWSISLKIKNNSFLNLFSGILLNGERGAKANDVNGKVVVHDLSKGLPFDNDSVDVVYHSHMLEHINRMDARAFLKENYRVLKPGGILRVVVPDMEILCRKYISAIGAGEGLSLESYEHYIEEIIEQCVRVEAFGSSRQSQPRRLIENLILGDARKRGETHQWMYDCMSLSKILKGIGFKSIEKKEFDQSDIPEWNAIGLDLDGANQYKVDSLYIEAFK